MGAAQQGYRKSGAPAFAAGSGTRGVHWATSSNFSGFTFKRCSVPYSPRQMKWLSTYKSDVRPSSGSLQFTSPVFQSMHRSSPFSVCRPLHPYR